MSIHRSRVTKVLATATCSLLLGAAAHVRGAERQVPTHPSQAPQSNQVLSIATYNVKLMPGVASDGEWGKSKEERALKIPRALESLGDFDAVIFTEAFDDESRAVLLREMRIRGYRYNTCILGSAYKTRGGEKDKLYDQRRAMGPSQYEKVQGKWVETNAEERKRDDYGKAGEGDRDVNQDGGVFIVSRHPLSLCQEVVFAECKGSWPFHGNLVDCNSHKGFVYAKLRKNDAANYHLIGTHAQSNREDGKYSCDIQEVRRKQFRRIWKFIATESRIPQDQPVIIAGDFNIHRGADEFPTVMSIECLSARLPEFPQGDGAATKGKSWLDYLVTKDAWKAPGYAKNQVLSAQREYVWNGKRVTRDLSDHHPVWGYFDFRSE